jgi:hypothetical protein
MLQLDLLFRTTVLDFVRSKAFINNSHGSSAFYEIPYQEETHSQADKGGDERQVAGSTHQDGGAEK